MFIAERAEVLERLVVDLMFPKYDALVIQMKAMECA
jgi:hypothetical protein